MRVWWKRRTQQMHKRNVRITIFPTVRGTWTIWAVTNSLKPDKFIENIESEEQFQEALHIIRQWVNEEVPDEVLPPPMIPDPTVCPIRGS